MEWFKSWFDTKYYHILYKDRNDAEAQAFIDELAEKLHFQTDQTFLDLACGKGRHSVYLNKKGLDITGVDLSEESIEYFLLTICVSHLKKIVLILC
jgi:cyclopropane fatty-acyl-phospholipid synthase-like methyltransferase